MSSSPASHHQVPALLLAAGRGARFNFAVVM